MGLADKTILYTLLAKDKASEVIRDTGDAMEDTEESAGGLEGACEGLGLAITAAGVIAAGKAVYELGKLGAQSLRTKDAFANISGSSQAATANLDAMRTATRGAMSETEMMAQANQMLQMGIAKSADGLGRMTEMATRLGAAMGTDATASLENWNAMIANQSLPRLDTFGISSGRVRTRINELMEATADLTREEAFNIAVLEEGAVAMNRLGDAVEDDALAFERMEATAANLKTELAEQLAPAVADVLETGLKLFTWNKDMLAVLDEHSADVKAMSGSYSEYVAEMTRAANAARYLVDAQGRLTTVQGQVMQENYLLSQSMWEVNQMVVEGVTATDGWLVQMSAMAEAEEGLISLAEEQAERMLDSTDVMEIYTAAMEEGGHATTWVASQSDLLAESLGITATAQEMALQDAELLAAAYAADAINIRNFTAGMEQAVAGTLMLTDAERQSLTAQTVVAQATRDLAEAHKLAADEAATQAASTMDLATNLKEATSSQIASRLIGMLDPKKMGADAYGAAVSEIGLSFGLMDATSIALAQNMGGLAEAIESGIIPTEDVDEALKWLIEDAADGEVVMRDLLDEFGRAPGKIRPVGNALRDAGDGMGRMSANAGGAAEGIGIVGEEAYGAAPLVYSFADKLGMTNEKLLALVEGSPWELDVVVGSGGGTEPPTGGGGGVQPDAAYGAGAVEINVTVQTGAIGDQVDVEDLAWRISEVIGERVAARI